MVASVWLLCVLGAAGVLSNGQGNERRALTERFESRASTGASFVGAYVDYMFETERRLVPRLTRDLDRPEEFARTTALIGSSAAVLLDHRGRAVALAPAAPELRGQQLAARYPHLSSALKGARAVSDVVPSAVEGTSIVAFALPLSGGRFGVFSAGFTLADSPLKAFLERQPIRDTRGYILDSTGATIVSAGEGAAAAAEQIDVPAVLDGPTILHGRLLVASRVPGTAWTYVLDAPVGAVHAPVLASRTGDWLLLGVLAALSLAAMVTATLAMASRGRARKDKAKVDHRLRLTVQNAPIGMSMISLGHRFVEPNLQLCRMLGYSADELSAMTYEDVTHPVDVDIDQSLVEQLVAGEIENYELEKHYIRRDGTPLLGRLAVSVVRDDHGAPSYFVSQIEDVTEIEAARAQLEYRAHYDSLTGLANRSLLMDRLTTALAEDAVAGSPVAVAFCDVDHFKQINDVYGHHGGDKVLKEVAGRLEGSARADHTVARMGGDEFTILMPAVTVEDATQVLSDAIRALALPIEIAGELLTVGISVGLALAQPGEPQPPCSTTPT